MIIGNYKSRYASDEGIWNNWAKKWGFILVLAAMVFLPLFANNYILLIASQVGIFVIAVTGLDRTAIIAAMESRLQNSVGDEFDTSIAEIGKIGMIRLNALIDD